MIPSIQAGGSPLHIAAALGQLDRIQSLLDEGIDVDILKEDGTTPLHSASTMGQAKALSLLLKEGANTETRGKNGATALMMAAAMGHNAVVEALVLGGAIIDRQHTFAGTTALHFAAEMGRVEVIQYLCAKGANVHLRTKAGGIALHTAADTNQSSAVSILLGAPCNSSTTMLLAGDTTPMYLAAQRGFTEVVEALAEGGVNVNFEMPSGKFKGEVMSVSSIDSKTEMPYYEEKNTEIGNGATCLHAAVENGHIDTVLMFA